PTSETSRPSDPEETDWWEASTSSDHPGGNMRPSGDAATRPRADENAFQGLPNESWAPIICHSFQEEVCAKNNLSSAHSFIKRLWKIVGSRRFQSIWWGDDGNCIVIAEKMFRREVLARSGPLKIFETRSMQGFISQLSLYGFRQIEEHSPISASIRELQKVAAAGSALGKV
ncbi:HSFY1 protein, partial [Eurystomus gularis]|nr:HSFY1 protein [Eurystomus gularis]